MARATRSSANLEKSDSLAPLRPSTKKRKRLSNDNDDQPSPKLPRADAQLNTLKVPSAAGSYLHDSDATSILDILEAVDSQGLLDRVFPLPSHAPSQGSFSLRVLLKQSTQHPLWVLRGAVQNLFPLSLSYPRTHPSDTAVQQHRFCKVALSLIDQASRNVVRIPPTVTSFFDSEQVITPTSPSLDGESLDAPKTIPQSGPDLTYKKYALMQHLPSGNYWTSLNADIHNSSKQLKDLSLGNAELAAIFPTPSTSSASVVTLGSYHVTKPTNAASPLPEQRRVSSGSFLDYGTWASFAPSFDHSGEVVGRSDLGALLHRREQRRRAREQWKRERSEGIGNIIEVDEVLAVPKSGQVQPMNVDVQLEGLLPSDQLETLKDALKCLDLENAVQELLERNRRALQRLEELQKMRLSTADGSSSSVAEGSEEWETAHAILESLTVLASLRPHSTTINTPSIVPPISVLQKVQRTLARQPSEGWYGTLALTKTTALRDDATVKVRPGGITPVAASATAAPPVTTVQGPTTPYPGYSYAYGQQAYRPAPTAASYTPYKPGQYYQTPYLATATQPLGQQAYYSQPTFAGGASGQQPYAAYSAWYSQYSAPPGNAGSVAPSGSSSGRGTPQPVGTAIPSSYGSFFSAAGTPPPGVVRSPAVANTVLSNKASTPSASSMWNAYGQVRNTAKFIIRVPATSANIGPGFDVVGLSLSLYLVLTVTYPLQPQPTYLAPTLSYVGEGADEVPLDAYKNLTTRVALYVLRCHGIRHFPSHLSIHVDNQIPFGRGLGSSGAAVIAGVLLGNTIGCLDLPTERLLDFALMVERHPDNVTAALVGGFVGSYLKELDEVASAAASVPLSEVLPEYPPDAGAEWGLNPPLPPDGIGHYIRFGWSSVIKAIAIVPRFELSTAKARQVLPTVYSRKDLVFNLQRLAVLTTALAQTPPDPGLIYEAMKDRVHQPYRKALVPGLPEVTSSITPSTHPGLLGICLSGAGPTILALATGGFDKIAEDARAIFRDVGVEIDWKILEVTGGSVVQHQN